MSNNTGYNSGDQNRPNKKEHRKEFMRYVRAIEERGDYNKVIMAIDDDVWTLAKYVFNERMFDNNTNFNNYCRVKLFNKPTKKSPYQLKANKKSEELFTKYNMELFTKYNIFIHSGDIGVELMEGKYKEREIGLIWYDGVTGWPGTNGGEFRSPKEVLCDISLNKNIIAFGGIVMLTLNVGRKNTGKGEKYNKDINKDLINQESIYSIRKEKFSCYQDTKTKMLLFIYKYQKNKNYSKKNTFTGDSSEERVAKIARKDEDTDDNGDFKYNELINDLKNKLADEPVADDTSKIITETDNNNIVLVSKDDDSDDESEEDFNDDSDDDSESEDDCDDASEEEFDDDCDDESEDDSEEDFDDESEEESEEEFDDDSEDDSDDLDTCNTTFQQEVDDITRKGTKRKRPLVNYEE